MEPASFTIGEARPDELPALLAVQHEAFGRIADQFGIAKTQLPPLVESVGDLEQLASTGWRFIVARDAAGEVIGTVRGAACAPDAAEVEVGRLAVTESWLRQGVARALMTGLEDTFPEATRFELFTGADANVPLKLYGSLGYSVFRSELIGGRFELVWLEKRRSPR